MIQFPADIPFPADRQVPLAVRCSPGGRVWMVDGMVAIVTGAASGMGRAIAARLDQEGAIVIATDRVIDGVASPIRSSFPGLFEKLDVRRKEEWVRVAELASAHFGPPSILINNAGILHFDAMLETSTEQLRDIIDVNLIGAFIGIQTIAPYMIAQGKGSIVNICSIDATKATNGASAYAGAVAAGHQGQCDPPRRHQHADGARSGNDRRSVRCHLPRHSTSAGGAAGGSGGSGSIPRKRSVILLHWHRNCHRWRSHCWKILRSAPRSATGIRPVQITNFARPMGN
jgi:hypothetical protein